MLSALSDDSLIPAAAAFLISAVLATLTGLALMGSAVSLPRARALALRSLAGSGIGAVIYLATASWWPLVVGPFLTCPVTALTAALLFQRKH